MLEPSNDDDPMFGVFEHPGVSYTIAGGGDLLATTFAIRFTNEAIEPLAQRFRCAPDAYVIMGELVDGMRRIYGDDAVTVKQAAKGTDYGKADVG